MDLDPHGSTLRETSWIRIQEAKIGKELAKKGWTIFFYLFKINKKGLCHNFFKTFYWQKKTHLGPMNRHKRFRKIFSFCKYIRKKSYIFANIFAKSHTYIFAKIFAKSHTYIIVDYMDSGHNVGIVIHWLCWHLVNYFTFEKKVMIWYCSKIACPYSRWQCRHVLT